jgi:hypothetical protein
MSKHTKHFATQIMAKHALTEVSELKELRENHKKARIALTDVEENIEDALKTSKIWVHIVEYPDYKIGFLDSNECDEFVKSCAHCHGDKDEWAIGWDDWCSYMNHKCTLQRYQSELCELQLKSAEEFMTLVDDDSTPRVAIFDRLRKCRDEHTDVCFVQYSSEKWDEKFTFVFLNIEDREKFELSIIEEFETPVEYDLLTKLRKLVTITTGVSKLAKFHENEHGFHDDITSAETHEATRKRLLFHMKAVLSLFDYCPVKKSE